MIINTFTGILLAIILQYMDLPRSFPQACLENIIKRISMGKSDFSSEMSLSFIGHMLPQLGDIRKLKMAQV